jgi:hypothetical protein
VCEVECPVAPRRVCLRFKTFFFQFRQLLLLTSSESGSISGQFLFSTSARLSFESGGISASLIPIVRRTGYQDVDNGNNNIQTNNASFVTSTSSGSQDIHLTGPYFVSSPARPFRYDYPDLGRLRAGSPYYP